MGAIDCFAAYSLWKKQKRIEQDQKEWDKEILRVFEMSADRFLLERIEGYDMGGFEVGWLNRYKPIGRLKHV